MSSLEELLPACDFVSVHVPLTEKTRGLLGARELGSMRPASVLVQTARGGVVDESALVEALRYGAPAPGLASTCSGKSHLLRTTHSSRRRTPS